MCCVVSVSGMNESVVKIRLNEDLIGLDGFMW